MKKTLSVITTAAVLASCSHSTAVKFTLTGSDPQFEDGKYVYVLDETGKTGDSARIEKHGFTLKGERPWPTEAYLFMGSGRDAVQISDGILILENGAIRIENRNGSLVFTGTPQNDRNNALTEELAALEASGRLEAVDSLFRAVVLENRNVLGLSLLTELRHNLPGREVLQLADSFPGSFQRHPALLELREAIAGLRADVGKPYIDIAGRTPDGDSVSLAEVVRKPGNRFVLLDFGALWCGYCREEFPSLAALFTEYGTKGFDIFGVSFDANRKKWLECIATYDMRWTQIHPGFGIPPRRTQVWRDYSLGGIPSSFLIDCTTGIIIAKNLRGKALAEKLALMLD